MGSSLHKDPGKVVPLNPQITDKETESHRGKLLTHSPTDRTCLCWDWFQICLLPSTLDGTTLAPK